MRQTSKVVATSCAAVLVSLATVSGQGSAAPATPPATAPPTLSPKAYLRLFAPPRPEFDAKLLRQLEAARWKLKDVESGSARRFICGMPMLTPSPSVDPTFVVPPDPRTTFSMPVIPAPCQ